MAYKESSSITSQTVHYFLRFLPMTLGYLLGSYFSGRWQFRDSLLNNKIFRELSLNILSTTQYLPLKVLRQIQLQNLRLLLQIVEAKNTFWRRHFKDHNFVVSHFSELDTLLNLPIHDKVFYRTTSIEEYLIKEPSWKWNSHFTSGSSGIPFPFYIDSTSAFWRYLLVLRGNQWAGFRKGDVFIRGIREIERDATHHFAQGRTIFLPGTPETLKSILKSLNLNPNNGIVFYGFIEYFRRLTFDCFYNQIKVKGIVATGEPLKEGERNKMESFFRAPIYAGYSTREFGRVGQECEYKDGFHINLERFFIEIVDGQGNQLKETDRGRIIITDTKNFVMPFLRFELGDLGYLSYAPCPCGRTLPRLYLEGRTTDRVVLRERELPAVTLITEVNRVSQNILRYQIIQYSPEHFTIIIEPLPGFSQADSKNIENGFQRVLGNNIKITINADGNGFIIKRGKQQAFISLIKKKE